MFKRKAVSLIALIITIAILIIIAAAVIQKGMLRTDEAHIAEHNQNISATQEEVESYYYYQGGALPVINLTPYPIPSGSTLQKEITKNNEQNDNFYLIDLTKMGKVSGKEGTGIGDDIYIVSETRHTVYYVRGTTVKGYTYHGLISPNNNGILAAIVSPISAGSPTQTPTPTMTSTPTPIPGYYDGMVNSPKFAAGMTPVKWDGSAWVSADRFNSGSDWYDYRNTGGTANRWANVKLNDGSILVWIPRFTYQIASGYHTSTAGTINVKFSNGTTDDTSGGYTVHPAFYWGGWNILANAAMTKQAGGTELTGIWVGKFEASAANGLQDTSGDKIAIRPNVTSWRSLKISDAFDRCRQMQTLYSSTYGIDAAVDTHMLKNSEWGAIAYLSKYARGATEVSVNNDTGYVGGKGDYINNTNLSTTGNEYGVYDMSGCSMEYASCYLNNSNANLSSNGASLLAANAKYKDIFPVAGTDLNTNNYNLLNMAYGHAFWETSNGTQLGGYAWFTDNCWFMDTNGPFVGRGGYYSHTTGAGLFGFNNYAGATHASISWRVSVVVP